MIYGFGDMDEYNELSKEISSISARELIENESDPEMDKDLNSVQVPMLEADEFMPKKAEPSSEESDDVDAFFAAGNTPDKKKEPEAQLGGAAVAAGGDGNDLDPMGKDPLVKNEGLGGGLSSHAKFGLHEAFDKDATDEDPMKEAQNNANVFDKVKDTFKTALDMKFETPKTIKYDMDSTHAKNHVSDTPIRKIPRGW